MSTNTQRLPPRTIYLIAVLAVLVILCLALTICLATSPRPPKSGATPITTSDEAAQSAEDKINAVSDAPLGPFRVQLTQEEATSLLALRVPESPFLKPQIVFSGGKVFVSGVVNMGADLNVQSMWTVSKDVPHPRIVLERASIGPFALPSVLLTSVSSTINEMIDESGTGIFPTAVTIGDGTIIVDGDKSPPTVQ